MTEEQYLSLWASVVAKNGYLSLHSSNPRDIFMGSVPRHKVDTLCTEALLHLQQHASPNGALFWYPVGNDIIRAWSRTLGDSDGDALRITIIGGGRHADAAQYEFSAYCTATKHTPASKVFSLAIVAYNTIEEAAQVITATLIVNGLAEKGFNDV